MDRISCSHEVNLLCFDLLWKFLRVQSIYSRSTLIKTISIR